MRATPTNANLATTTATPTAAPPGIFNKPAVTPVNLASLLPAWPPEQHYTQQSADVIGVPPDVPRAAGRAEVGSELGIQYCADEDDTQLLAFEKLLPERGDESPSPDPAGKDDTSKGTESTEGRQAQPPSDDTVSYILSVIEKECGFLRIGGHGVHSVKLTKAKQHPRVRAVLCLYIRGLPSRKRTKWLMPLAWSVAAVLQQSGCTAAVHGGYLYVAPSGHTGPALPVDFALWAGDDRSPHADHVVDGAS
jgi:hypothetical protein